jgi:hypothetical protein
VHPDIERFYITKPELTRSCLFALRDLILNHDDRFSEALKYGMPFFCINGKMVCYLWINKKTLQPYICIVDGNKIDHPKLVQDKRARMKIMLVDPEKNLPVRTIKQVLKECVRLVEKGNR